MSKHDLHIIYKLYIFVPLIIKVTTMNERLAMFLHAENMTAAKFAEILQVQPSSISHLLSGRNKPNFDFIARMLKMFADINPDWLINGIGNMYRGNNGNNRENLATYKLEVNEVTTDKNELDFTSTNIDNENITNVTFVTHENDTDQDTQTSQVPEESKAKVIDVPVPVPNTESTNNSFNDTLIDKIVVFHQDNTFTLYNKRC